jgi:transcriptional regulator with XRE-family HTH domain
MQTIGERLEDARKKKGVSIREAAEATKIRGEYLQKFEGNQFDIGLTDIYTRGFLRGYCNYLRLPSERILNDFSSLRGGGDVRPRQPSREVYGRMDLAISSPDERGEPPGEPAASEPTARNSQGARFQRPPNTLPKSPAISPAVMMRGGLALAAVLIVAVFVLLYRSFFPGAPAPAPAAHAAPAATEAAGEAATSIVPAPTVTIVALDDVRVKVVRKSDGLELFQGKLAAGERRDYANVPIYLTASELGSVEIEYKGHRYPTGHIGHERIQFDFSGR